MKNKFKSGDKVRINFTMDQHAHNGEIGTIEKVIFVKADGDVFYVYRLGIEHADPVHGRQFLENEIKLV